jgi:hypothetical protein
VGYWHNVPSVSLNEIAMKNLFPGYFTPTEHEFATLWGEAVFAFDASVLLGLYRSTIETQQVFFDIIDKIADRVFLPHQAAWEYLKNRLGVISLRADSYTRIRNESEKFAKFLELIIQEHALPNGEEITTVAKDAAKQIVELVAAAEKEEPDLLRSDGLLSKLAGVFGTRTGPPFERPRLKELHAEAAQRYALEIPPGYKDEKKGEPDKFGDALIWFQLIDQAKLAKKPIIFVTGDLKEDWWLQHKGATVGPRPELRQEMMAAASVHFYMYTMPRFLEFAKQFLDLNFDTKKAETEFEEIEKQDKQAAYQITNFMPLTSALNNQVWQNSNQSFPASTWLNYPGSIGGETAFTTVPGSATSIPVGLWYGDFEGLTAGWANAGSVDSEPKGEYFLLLPVNGYVFPSLTGKWKCSIVREPSTGRQDRVCYRLRFDPDDHVGKSRYLELWTSADGLHRDTDGRYKSKIFGIICRWLDKNQDAGQLACFP